MRRFARIAVSWLKSLIAIVFTVYDNHGINLPCVSYSRPYTAHVGRSRRKNHKQAVFWNSVGFCLSNLKIRNLRQKLPLHPSHHATQLTIRSPDLLTPFRTFPKTPFFRSNPRLAPRVRRNAYKAGGKWRRTINHDGTSHFTSRESAHRSFSCLAHHPSLPTPIVAGELFVRRPSPPNTKCSFHQNCIVGPLSTHMLMISTPTRHCVRLSRRRGWCSSKVSSAKSDFMPPPSRAKI